MKLGTISEPGTRSDRYESWGELQPSVTEGESE